MSAKTKTLIITLLVAIPALLTGQTIWPPAIGLARPTTAELPFFIFLAVIESLALGLGVSFAIFGWKYISHLTAPDKNRALAAYLCIIWQLVSWWPHDNLHQHIGTDLHRLLGIEYGFHLTLILSSLILAWIFTGVVKEKLD